jgi:hypothetical protein
MQDGSRVLLEPDRSFSSNNYRSVALLLLTHDRKQPIGASTWPSKSSAWMRSGYATGRLDMANNNDFYDYYKDGVELEPDEDDVGQLEETTHRRRLDRPGQR